MLKLSLPFHLTFNIPRTFLRGGCTQPRRQPSAEVVLEGLTISIRVGTKIYEVASDRSLEEGSGPSRGTAWTRSVWQLGEGITIEQQMALPVDGDAFAISWRSVGLPLFPCRFELSPIFSAAEPFAPSGFRFEPETNGGRLTWQPLENSSKIIADTNGRFDPLGLPSGAGDVPAAFEFNLSPQPAVLIFSSEFPRRAGTDPLVGGFLARLSLESGKTTESERFNNLAAA